MITMEVLALCTLIFVVLSFAEDRNNKLHCNCFSWKSERINVILKCIDEIKVESISYRCTGDGIFNSRKCGYLRSLVKGL